MPIDISILIVNWNSRRYLRQCLESIRTTADEIPHESIVVDNASHDGSADMVREEFPEVDLYASNENLGFAKGNNLAFSRSRGRYVLIMNPDVTVLEGTLKGLIEFADAHPEAGIVSPKLLNPDRTSQKKYYGRIPTLSTIFFVYTRIGALLDAHLLGNRIRQRNRYEQYGDFQETLSFTDGGAAFCCTLVPRRLIEQIGFMDERFPLFFNDGDFAFRLFRAGYKAYIIPHVQACHYGGTSVQQLDQTRYTKEFVYGLRAYYHKHRGLLYTLAIDSVLGLNVGADLFQAARDIVLGRKRVREIVTPLKNFKDILAYQPPNACRKGDATTVRPTDRA